MITIDPVSATALGIIIYELSVLTRKLERTNDKVSNLQDQIDEIRVIQR